MPKQIACGAGQACPSGSSCFDFSNFTGTVPGWSTDTSVKYCFPDGLILAVEGHAANGGTYVSSSGSTGGTLGVDNGQGGKGTGTNTSTGVTTGTPSSGSTPPSVTPATPVSDTSNTTTGTGTAKVQGGGCTLAGGHGAAIDLGMALALSGLVVRIARRRRSVGQ
jgi:hypothetical protein